MVTKKTLKAKDIENLENTTLATAIAIDASDKILVYRNPTLGCASLSCVATLGCPTVYCCAGGCCVTV
jgi:hypothetical protein